MTGEPVVSPIDPVVEATARDLYRRLLDAWNRRDADGYAALFAPDGTAIGFDGSLMTGSTEIRTVLASIFANHPTAAYLALVREVRPLGPSAVLLRAVAGMVPPDGSEPNPAVNAQHVLTADRAGPADGSGAGGDWRIVLFQNTPAQYHGRPDLTEQHTAELRKLLTSTG